MSRATLAVILSKLALFPKPNTTLEQYPTPSEAAATILWDAHIKGLLAGKHVLDVGAGTGILGIGALILGAKVTFIEIDERLKEIIQENIKRMHEEVEFNDDYEIIIQDATKGLPPADLALTNPPFGTKERHADKAFLEAIFTATPECYSFHKTATEHFLTDWLRRQGITLIQTYPFTFNLPKTMMQHQKAAHHVAITCLHTRKDL